MDVLNTRYYYLIWLHFWTQKKQSHIPILLRALSQKASLNILYISVTVLPNLMNLDAVLWNHPFFFIKCKTQSTQHVTSHSVTLEWHKLLLWSKWHIIQWILLNLHSTQEFCLTVSSVIFQRVQKWSDLTIYNKQLTEFLPPTGFL